MKHTIVIKRNGVMHKVTKLVFSGDGSYYVTVPYHVANKAILLKATVDYDASTLRFVDDYSYGVAKTELLDLGYADNDRVKLSHHPDGFVQFSGPGVLSGRHPDGTPKGVGLFSTRLGYKFDGPAFCVGLTSLDEFPSISTAPNDVVLLDADAIYSIPGCSALQIDAHYFPPMWYRFIQKSESGTLDTILLRHPCTAVVKLAVLRMPEKCAIPGFFGFELFTMPTSDAEISSDKVNYPHFSLGGPAGNLRIDKNGHRLADGVSCMYPREGMDDSWLGRSLNFARPQQAPPGDVLKAAPEE